MRTLPLRLTPVDGREPPGYVARYSHTFGFPPATCSARSAWRTRRPGRAAPDAMASGSHRSQLARVSFVTGIDSERLSSMLLARYADRRSRDPRSRADQAAARGARSRSDGLALALLPPLPREARRVAVALAARLERRVRAPPRAARDRCPGAAAVTRMRPPAAWPRDDHGRRSVIPPAACNAAARGCRASLATVPAIAVNEELSTPKRRIDALLEHGPQPTLAGENLDPPTFLQDLRALANILYDRPRPEGNPGRPRRSCVPVLDDPKVLAGVLPGVLALAELPDPDTLADALRELIDRATTNRRDPATLEGQARVTRLDAALRRAVNESAWASPSSRLGFSAATTAAPRSRPRTSGPARSSAVLGIRLRPRTGRPARARRLRPLRRAAILLGPPRAAAHPARLGRRRALPRPARALHPRRLQHDLRQPPPRRRVRRARAADQTDRQRPRQAQLIDYKRAGRNLAAWTGIDAHTWRLIQPEPLPPSRRWDRPRRRARASVWLWCQLTSGHERAAPIALPHPGLRHQYAFVRAVIPALRERLLLLGDILLATPAGRARDRASPVRGRAQARRTPRPEPLPTTVSPLIRDRVLAHASAHTGVDIPTITASPAGAANPAAVAHARLLTAVLLQDIALASPAAIASILQGDPGRLGDNHRAYRTTLARTPQLAGELAQLTRAIEAWETPAPTPPSTSHHERMIGIATGIKALANDLFADRWASIWRSAPACSSAHAHRSRMAGHHGHPRPPDRPTSEQSNHGRLPPPPRSRGQPPLHPAPRPRPRAPASSRLHQRPPRARPDPPHQHRPPTRRHWKLADKVETWLSGNKTSTSHQ